ncbi:DUF3146 family protein [Prochlorothrix hollandica]|uniref:DUF3146 domain-containing protein n=1 Tax=Prochlorothrix hollandica PCC 9006 = CALU 1027 TaxID=317619 RepID=A0A0M2PXN6_PROHO|nr:DUF3146 family protein [Prochlorothrix hollandica]KKJ00930.1 hypothetical protein PROH_00305 [Prochlorothrix hollandica PCC 9006 = CALU 1027]
MTTAHVRIIRQSWSDGTLEGEVQAGAFEWQFQWNFYQGDLVVNPSLGRALIQDALNRFLVQQDYQLEPGSNYCFTVRAKF